MAKFLPDVGSSEPDDLAGCGDEEVMDALVAGDSAALDVLLCRYWSRIVTFAAAFVRNSDVAEDIGQETFLRVWQTRDRWQRTGSVRSFLYRVARNLALNERRSAATHARLGVEVRKRSEHQTPDPARVLEQSEIRRAVEIAIDALPERRREVFLLSRYHGLSYREIAETLEISPQTVANHLSAALSTLRDTLDPVRNQPR